LPMPTSVVRFCESSVFSVSFLLQIMKKAAGPFRTSGLRVLRSAPIQLNCCLRELNFLSDYVSDNRNAILNFQFLDLAVAKLLTKPDQARPLFRNQLNYLPVVFVLTLINHDIPRDLSPFV
jgi:hypothetical protein